MDEEIRRLKELSTRLVDKVVGTWTGQYYPAQSGVANDAAAEHSGDVEVDSAEARIENERIISV